MFGVIEVTTCRFNRSTAERVTPKRIRLTITFRYDLSDHIQTLIIMSYFGLHLDAENPNSAKCFEEVLDATPGTDATFDGLWVIPQHKGELLYEMIENLWVIMVNFRDLERNTASHWREESGSRLFRLMLRKGTILH
jgi:hypothetical protein